ncbi:MAG TPA: anti-sigma factor [Gaiellales bacterium]|jgi:anti-sigma factor RsiW|nr:anti-sigma factor [Gaiellales bacterium]
MTDFAVQEPTCQELAEFLTDYLEGLLGAAERASFDRHIAACRDCTQYIAQMRVTIAVTGRIRSDEIPPAVRHDLLTAFRGWAQTL